jgi:ribonuclease HI
VGPICATVVRPSTDVHVLLPSGMSSRAPLPVVWIHADESCLGNQFKERSNRGGAGGLMETWIDGEWIARDFWLSEPDTTNNRMAIWSAIAGLTSLRRPTPVHFVSDSQYLVKGASEWMPGWKRRGWKRRAGPIENLDLWKKLDRVLKPLDVTWHWVRGHDGHPRNEYVNDLAVRAANEQDSSDGLVESGFVEWLNEHREKRQRYLDFMEFVEPELE